MFKVELNKSEEQALLFRMRFLFPERKEGREKQEGRKKKNEEK